MKPDHSPTIAALVRPDSGHAPSRQTAAGQQYERGSQPASSCTSPRCGFSTRQESFGLAFGPLCPRLHTGRRFTVILVVNAHGAVHAAAIRLVLPFRQCATSSVQSPFVDLSAKAEDGRLSIMDMAMDWKSFAPFPPLDGLDIPAKVRSDLLPRLQAVVVRRCRWPSGVGGVCQGAWSALERGAIIHGLLTGGAFGWLWPR